MGTVLDRRTYRDRAELTDAAPGWLADAGVDRAAACIIAREQAEPAPHVDAMLVAREHARRVRDQLGFGSHGSLASLSHDAPQGRVEVFLISAEPGTMTRPIGSA